MVFDSQHWDLNTGQVVRSFPGHAGQISSLSFRPLQPGQNLWDADPQSPTISIRASAAPASPGHKLSRERSASTHMTRTLSNKGGTSTNTSPVKGKTTLNQHITANDSEKASDSRMGDSEVEPTTALTGSVNGDTPSKATPFATPSSKRVASPLKVDISAQTPPDTPSKKSKEAEESLFGDDGPSDDMDLERDLNEALGLGLDDDTQGKAGSGMVGMDDGEELQEPERPSNTKTAKEREAIEKEKDKDADADADSEGDSLFGGESGAGSANGDADAEGEADADGEPDADADADGEADPDAEGEEEDADGEDDDEPLAARLITKMTAGVGTGTLELPGGSNGQSPQLPALKANGEAIGLTNGKDSNGIARKKALPKPTFGGVEVAAGYDGDVSKFSNDIFMTTTLGGQVTLWDKRVPSYTSDSTTPKGVRALALPDKTPPWCMSACWNSTGDKIYVGRRNETVDEWDLRMIPDVEQGQASTSTRKGNARFARSLRFPNNSGPVTAVAAMPNGRHIVCGSYDNVRLWDTEALESKVPFRIVAGHHGATVSQIIVDPTCRFLFTSSGDRGWLSTSTETVLLHEVQGL